MKSIDVPGGVVNSLKDSLDGILGLRDSLGAALLSVSLITRTWAGDEPGDGAAADVLVQVLPSPRIVKMNDASRVVEGGTVQLGDIFLKQISKNSYPNKSDVDGTSATQNIEKLYDLGGELYRVIDVTENHLTWTVQVRKLSNQKRFDNP